MTNIPAGPQATRVAARLVVPLAERKTSVFTAASPSIGSNGFFGSGGGAFSLQNMCPDTRLQIIICRERDGSFEPKYVIFGGGIDIV